MLNNRNRTDEQLLERWEDSREIRNLMGIYTQKILYKEENELSTLWSERPDVALGFNDGWYIGREAIAAYYNAVSEQTTRGSELLAARFPEEAAKLDKRQLSALGQFDVKPTSSDLVEIAEDRRTAQGIWSYQGSDVRMTAYGPLSYWTFGFYAADFVREGSGWKLWHLRNITDIDRPCGEKWWEEEAAREIDPFFSAMGELTLPPYSLPAVNHTPFSPKGSISALPRLPEPYETFTAQISYGPEGEDDHV